MHDMDTKNTCGCGCGQHGGAGQTAYDGPDWASLPDHTLVCPCRGVSKAQVKEAIRLGAYTVPLLGAMTGAGRGNECAQKHPQGRSCQADLAELIRIYQTEPPPLEPGDGCGCS